MSIRKFRTHSKKEPMKTINTTILVFLLAAEAAFAQGGPAKVSVEKVFEKEVAKANRLVGAVDFDTKSGISSEISGLIRKKHVVEGALVKKGDVLARLNTDFVRKNIEIIKMQIEQADIRIGNTEKNLKRYEVLFQKDAASEKVYEDLADEHKEILKQKGILHKNIEKLELEMRKSVIRAPFDGLILENFKNEGEWISPGTAICTLAAVDDVNIRVAVSEDLVKFIKPGDKVSVALTVLEKEIEGTVKNYVPVADMKSKTFQIKIAIPHFKEAIQNMSAIVNVPVSDKMTLRMIKRDGLVRFNGKDFVYTVKEGKAAMLPVKIVAFEGEYFGVDSPLVKAGMPIVVDGNDRLRPDQPVAIINADDQKENKQ